MLFYTAYPLHTQGSVDHSLSETHSGFSCRVQRSSGFSRESRLCIRPRKSLCLRTQYREKRLRESTPALAANHAPNSIRPRKSPCLRPQYRERLRESTPAPALVFNSVGGIRDVAKSCNLIGFAGIPATGTSGV